MLLKLTEKDLVNNSVRITLKKEEPRETSEYLLKLANMLNEIPKDANSVFTYNTNAVIRNFGHQRKKIAFKSKIHD